MRDKLKAFLLKIRDYLLNPHLVLCFTVAWIITNGWAYIALVIGRKFGIRWLAVLAGTYLAVLWSPFCAEGIVTCIIAVFLLRLIFPDDDKTMAVLKDMSSKARQQVRHIRKKKKSAEINAADDGENTEE